MSSAYECRCGCHSNSGIMHCMPCCSPCPICHRNIRHGCIEAHIASSHPNSPQAKPKRFRISLDPLRQVIVPNVWPATIFGDKGYIEREFKSPQLAKWEIGDEFGVDPSMLKAEEVK